MTPLDRKLERAHKLTVIGVIAMVVQGLLPALMALPDTSRWVIDLSYCVPLLLFLPFLKTTQPSRYAWLCFVVLVYFCEGVLKAFNWPGPGSINGLLIVLLTTEIFLAGMMATRWSGQRQAQSTAPHA